MIMPVVLIKQRDPLQNNKILVALLSEHNLIKKGYRQISFHLGIVFAYTDICNISPLIDHEKDRLDFNVLVLAEIGSKKNVTHKHLHNQKIV